MSKLGQVCLFCVITGKTSLASMVATCYNSLLTEHTGRDLHRHCPVSGLHSPVSLHLTSTLRPASNVYPNAHEYRTTDPYTVSVELTIPCSDGRISPQCNAAIIEITSGLILYPGILLKTSIVYLSCTNGALKDTHTHTHIHIHTTHSFQRCKTGTHSKFMLYLFIFSINLNNNLTSISEGS